MSTHDPAPLVPELRFPEFREARGWRPRLAGSLFSRRKENGKPGLPLYSVTIDSGMVDRSTFDRDFYDIEDAANNSLVRKGDIAYNTMRMWQGACGVAPVDCLVSPAYVILSPKAGAHSKFFEHLFKTALGLQLLEGHSRGLTKDRLRLYYEDFSSIRFYVPGLAEQVRIADCLNSLDALIEAEGRKLDALEQYKQGLLQQLFPQPGETVPQRRFPEFERLGGWKLRRLGELAHFRSGSTPSKQNPDFWEGSIPWVSAKDMKQMVLTDSQDHITEEALSNGAKLVPKGSVLVLTRGMTLLRDVPICLLDREMSFNQDVKALLPKMNGSGHFLAYALSANKQVIQRRVDIAGHGTGKLNTDELKALEIAWPQSKERRTVTDFLSTLDDQLVAQARKVDALTEHKRSLRQQLFPSLDGL